MLQPEKAQPFGQRANKMVFDKVAVVETDKRDRYGSRARVIHQGRNVNLERIRRGMAWLLVSL